MAVVGFKRSGLAVGVAALSIAMTLSACGSNGGGDGGSDGPIVIGAQLDLTGPAAFAGIGGKQGIELALAEINDKGGVDGRKLKLVTADSKTNPAAAALAVRELVQQDKAAAVISVASSTATLGAVPVAEQLKVPFLASAAGDDAILKGSPKWIWRGSSVATTEAGSLIAKYVGDTYSPKKVVVIKDKTTAYTEAEAKSIVDTLESQGATVDSSQSVEEGQSNFLAQTSAIKKVAPDVIVLTGYPAVTAPLTRQIRQSGIKAPIVSDQVAVGDDFLQLAGDEGKGVVGFWSSGPYFTDDDPQMKAWLAAFTKKFPNAGKGYPNFLTVWAYADTYALLDAMRRAGSTDASAVQKALNSTDAYLNGPDTELGGIPIGLPRTWTADEHDGTHELRAYEVSGGKWVPVS